MGMGKQASWLTITKIMSTGISMIVTMMLSRFRSLEEYGVYSQINLISTIAVSVFSMGMAGCINYFLNRSDSQEDKKKFLSTYFVGGTLISVAIAVVLLIIYPFLVRYFKNDLLYEYVFAVLLFPWIAFFNNSVENIYISYQKINWLITYRLSYCVLLFLIVFLFSVFGGDFYTYMICFVVLQIIYVLALYYSAYVLSGKVKKLSIDKALIKEILTYSVPLGISTMISTLNIELDKLMVSRLYSLEEMSIYTNVSKELPLNIVSVSILAVMLPKMVSLISKNKNQDAITLWGVSIKLSSFLIVFLCMVLFVFAEPVICLLYSEKYLPGADIFRIYAITSLVKITTWGIVLNATKKTKYILGISVVSLGINFMLNLIFMPILGMKGAAIATLVSEFATIFLKLWISAKVLCIKVRNIVPWRSLFGIIILNILIGAMATGVFYAFINRLNMGIFGSAIMVGSVALILYFCIIFRSFKKSWKHFNEL